MQEGQHVVFIDRAGVARPGTVAAVLGSGPSEYKVLNILLDDPDPASVAGGNQRYIEKNVPHRFDSDQEPGRGYWQLTDDPTPAPSTVSTPEPDPTPAPVSPPEDPGVVTP